MSCTSHNHDYEKAADLSFPSLTIDGDTISAESIANEMQYHPAETAEQALQQSVQALVIKQLLSNEVQRSGLLEQHGGNEEVAVSELLGLQATPKKASEQECLQYYQANQQRFHTAPFIAARHILLAAAPDDFEQRDQAKQQAQALVGQLQDKLNLFAELAQQHSACPSKETGGALGQLSKGQTTPEFERQVFTLEEGLCPQPIESRYGFHVVDIEKKIEGELMPFDTVETKVANYLNERAQRKAISEYIRALIDQAEITGIDKELLSPSYDH